MLALGYKRPDGKPDVSRFCKEKRHDKSMFYEWIGDRSSPEKYVDALAKDLGVNKAWLLFGDGKEEAARRAAPD